MFKFNKVALAFTGPVCLAAAVAQSPAGLENESVRQFRQEQERQRLQQERLQPQPDLRIPPPVQATSTGEFPEDESPCFKINDIQLNVVVSGGSADDWGWLNKHLQSAQDPGPVVGRCLGAQGVSALMARLQQAVVQAGWTTTRIIAPPQDLSSGVLRLDVLPGVVSRIRFQEGHGERAALINTLPIEVGQVLNLRDLEQGLENFKRVPTVEADIGIEPGAQPGQSELVIRHTQALPLRVLASVDDSGASATGTYQGSITFSYDNWWTLSDLFYMTFQSELGGKDDGARGNAGHTVHYSVPWGYNLLSLNSARSRYHQTVAGAFQNYVYSGQSEQHDVRLSRVVQRDPLGKTTLALRAFHRRSRNFIDDTEIEVQRRAVSGLDISLGHRRSLDQGHWEATLTHRQGLKLWGALPAPEEAFGEGTSRMRLWLLDASLSLPFALGQQRWLYQGSLRSQWHQTPLTPQDRFAVGGRYTVRGFDGSTVLSAESGVLVRHEWSTTLGQSPYSVYIGADWGRVSGPSAAWLQGHALSGGVLGLRSHWKTGPVNTQLDLFVGQPIKKPEHFKADKSVYGFGLNTQF